MKKHIIFAAFAAVLALTSCEKDVFEVKEDNAYPVFTASIDVEDSKTTVDLSTKKVSWELNDEITVTEEYKVIISKKTKTRQWKAKYKVSAIDANGKATFVFVSKINDEFGTQAISSTSDNKIKYYATYGTEPTTIQAYSSPIEKLYMKSGTITTTTQPVTVNFTFSVACGLMKINLTKAGESVKQIKVTRVKDGEETTYTLNCETDQSIASGKDFYLVLPTGTYTRVEITNSSDIVCTLLSQGATLESNKILPLTVPESKIEFLDPSGPKYFSISATEKVIFSPGNLWTNTTVNPQTWSFETNQYDFPTTYDASHVSHFFWETTGNYGSGETCITTKGTASDVVDWGVPYCSANGLPAGTWRTLTSAEWKYLLSVGGVLVGKRYGKYKANVTVAGSSCCIIIAPDNFNGTIAESYTAETWADAESTYGLVCIPTNGVRQNKKIDFLGHSAFWTASTTKEDKATDWWDGSFDTEGDRSNGGAVRLVKAYTE